MLPTNKMLSASVRKSIVLFRCNCHSMNLKHIALSLSYLDSESDSAELHETVDLIKSKPVIVVSSCSSKPTTIFRPGLVERHRTSIDPPLHQDPTVESKYWQSDSRVGAQSSNGRRLVCCLEICTVVLTVPAHSPLCLFLNYGLSEQWYGLDSSCQKDR